MTTSCYFCKKEFEPWEYDEDDIEHFARYQVDAFKIVGNVDMHKECREEWEEKWTVPIPKELEEEEEE